MVGENIGCKHIGEQPVPRNMKSTARVTGWPRVRVTRGSKSLSGDESQASVSSVDSVGRWKNREK